jgi:hypothetical protein
MNTTPIFPGFETLVKPFKFPSGPYEYKVTALRECPTPDALQQCETPDKAADYWRMHIAAHPHFNPDCECLAVLLLNTRASRGRPRPQACGCSPGRASNAEGGLTLINVTAAESGDSAAFAFIGKATSFPNLYRQKHGLWTHHVPKPAVIPICGVLWL